MDEQLEPFSFDFPTCITTCILIMVLSAIISMVALAISESTPTPNFACKEL